MDSSHYIILPLVLRSRIGGMAPITGREKSEERREKKEEKIEKI
ncbi:hypothetical protein N9L19_01205 [bacterium]|nr:hypothetical protein [bacterium]